MRIFNMRELTMEEVRQVAGGARTQVQEADDLEALGIAAGLLAAPEITLPMMIAASASMIGLQIENLS